MSKDETYSNGDSGNQAACLGCPTDSEPKTGQVGHRRREAADKKVLANWDL
ncbi:hypothetical protein M2267_005510 [Ensifer sp. KUDG1]|uniref:hypothetical protein n=1 Tax=Ensifer sp. KUDG1 TaxID=3373919 RepID=UPI003D2202DE